MSEKRPSPRHWTSDRVAAVKAETKATLEAAAAGMAPADRLAFILKQLRALQDQSSATDPVRHYVWAVSALVHHERFGGLKASQIRRIVEYAVSVLQASGIRPGSSQIAERYGEVYLAQSQIARRHGRAWESAWLQQMAHHAILRKSPIQRSQSLLGKAIRTLRLGEAASASTLYEAVEELKVSARHVLRARLGRVICGRLMGQLEIAAALSADAEGTMEIDDRTGRELAWEAICRTVVANGDMRPMLVAVRPGGAHRDGYFVLEAWFWARVVQKTEWAARLPNLTSQMRDPHLKPQRYGLFFKLARAIERFCDTEYPLMFRAAQLGAELAKADQLLTLERELLVWAAAYRALSRAHVPEFAALALSAYSGLSLKLTGGASEDALQVLRQNRLRPGQHGRVIGAKDPDAAGVG